MKQLPKISIIIPVYNVAEYIDECLQSVMRQTYKGEIECLLVDDCGTDNSITIAEKLIADYKGPISFHILHHDHNRGLSAARNTGTDAATGDYIYYLDSDDYITDDCIEVLTKPLRKREYDMVQGNHCCFGEESDFYPMKQEADFVVSGREYLESWFWGTMPVTAWNKLIRLQFLRENHFAFAEGILHEDIPFSFRFACVDSMIYACVHTTYMYRIRENSIKGDLSANLIKERDSLLDVYEQITKNLPNKEYDALYDEILHTYALKILEFTKKSNQSIKNAYLRINHLYPYTFSSIRRAGKLTKTIIRTRWKWLLPAAIGYLLMAIKS